MARVERIREVVKGPLNAEYLSQMTDAGWQLVAVEWKREAEGEGEEIRERGEEVPYGLRVAQDCMHLEENPAEKQVMMLMMELIVQDHRLSHVADELNQKGFRTRQGTRWSPVSVFYMLPRLIEAGPRIFSSEEWATRRQHLFKLV